MFSVKTQSMCNSIYGNILVTPRPVHVSSAIVVNYFKKLCFNDFVFDFLSSNFTQHKNPLTAMGRWIALFIHTSPQSFVHSDDKPECSNFASILIRTFNDRCTFYALILISPFYFTYYYYYLLPRL